MKIINAVVAEWSNATGLRIEVKSNSLNICFSHNYQITSTQKPVGLVPTKVRVFPTAIVNGD